jgi:uncharacterized protein with PIN domain
VIPCFAVEKTLGRLAKWLRLIGFDTEFEPELPVGKFPDGLDEKRILLTRTQWVRKKFASRQLIFVESNHLDEQLQQIIIELNLKAEHIRPFSRCLQCNVSIVAVAKSELRGQVPDHIFEIHDHFNQCPECERIYWSGSHTGRSLEKIRRLFV